MRLVVMAIAAVLSIMPVLHADQQEWIGEDDAQRAAALMPADSEIRHFCEPCDDLSWTPETVSTVEVRPTGSDDLYEVAVNDRSVDLAYVYIEQDGRWVNLALHLGLEATGVSEVLPSGASGFGQTWFAGTVGEKAVYMQLTEGGSEINGSYWYGHIGLPIEVNGTIDEDRALALTEFADGKRTGLFAGKFDEERGVWSGKWLSPDGARELPFRVHRIAILIEESRSVLAGEQNLEATVTIPYFVEQNAPQAEAVNRAVRQSVEEAWQNSVNGWSAEVAYAINEPPEETYSPIPHSLDVISGTVYHYAPSLVSVTCHFSSYSGGAHGMSWIGAQNVWIQDGKARSLGLSDLFKPDSGYLAAISAFCIEDLKKKEASSVVDGGITEFSGEQMSTFAISRAGLTVFFAPYAVASYAEGAFEVIVPWDIVAPLLRSEIAAGLTAVPETSVSEDTANG